MKKIAFIGHYRDGTGYGYAAQNLVECISTIPNIKVEPIWICLIDKTKRTTDIIDKLEKESTYTDIDTIIYCTLPQYFVRKAGVKNIGVFFTETSRFTGSNWAVQCNTMDEIWVSCQASYDACINSNVSVPIKIVPVPINVNNYNDTHTELANLESIKNKCIFYTISEISYRKNIMGIIAAYYAEFSIYDNVALVIKGFHNGKTPEQSEKEFSNAIEQLKQEIKTGFSIPKPPVLYISEYLSEEQLAGLHQSSDCFVSMSRGEAWCLPLVDSIMYNKRAIVSNWGGPKDIAEGTNIRRILGNIKPVFGMGKTFSKLYWGDEFWYEPRIDFLMEHMRGVYIDIMKNGKAPSESMLQDRQHIINKYGFETMSKKLQQLLT